jgi:hypothetical protein
LKIPEVEWIKENKHKLDKYDIEALNDFNFFEQIEEGQLSQSAFRMLELMQLLDFIYRKYVTEVD